MYDEKDVSPVKAIDLSVFGKISLFFVGSVATYNPKI
jgi:hypothetical protein